MIYGGTVKIFLLEHFHDDFHSCQFLPLVIYCPTRPSWPGFFQRFDSNDFIIFFINGILVFALLGRHVQRDDLIIIFQELKSLLACNFLSKN